MKKNLIVRILAGCLILVFGMAMAACTTQQDTGAQQQGDTQQSQAQEKEQEQQETKADEQYLIGFSQGTMNHPWRIAMIEGNKKYAEENYPDVKLVTTDGQNTSSKQVTDMESLIAQKPDVILLSPLTEDALTPVAKQAMAAGIPVITVDRKVNTEVTAHIGAENYPLGVTGADFLAEELGSKGNIIEIQGTAGASATVERNKGFRDTIAEKYPDMKVIAEQYCDYLREPAMKFMEDMLQRFPAGEIQAVYAHNDEMALGAVQAIKAAGRLDEIKVIGMDGENLAIEAVKNGEMAATITYPFCAPEAIQYAYKVAKGEEIDKNIVLDGKLINAENVDEYLGKGF